MNRISPALGALSALLLAGCAHMEPPPGGPEDKIRPYVTAAFPAPGAVNAPRDLQARIAFSEWVAADAARNKVYLNPPPARKLQSKLSGNILEITSAAPLEENTTYVLGVLPTIQDLRGLPLERPLQLSFSTGSSLDSGKLSGALTSFVGKPAPGGFAALYPRGPELRARFRHLTRVGDSAVVPAAHPDPRKELPAYIAPSDSQGRFDFQGVRPGLYALLGFQDINGDLNPGIGSEALAIGPTVEAGAAMGEIKTLALFPYDTVPVRLTEAHWAGESLAGGRSAGTVRLKFNRPPHPTQSLRREAYAVRKLGADSAKDAAPPAPGAASVIPVLDVCHNPSTGEIELATPPLEVDGRYEASILGLRDMHGNPADTVHDRAPFRVAAEVDTAKPLMVFLGPRKVSGEMARLPTENLIPGRGITVYHPRLLTDSVMGALRNRLIIRADTLAAPFSIARQSHHEFRLEIAIPGPLKGQRLSIAMKPEDTASAIPGSVPVVPSPAAPAVPTAPGSGRPGTDSAKAPKPPAVQPAAIAAFTLADASKMGSLTLRQDPSAYGSRLVIRGVGSPWEFSSVTPAAPEAKMDSLPEGAYSVDYFRDANGDGLWNPGSLSPWAVQEAYARFADSVAVKAGGGSMDKVPAGPDSAASGAAARSLSWPPAF